MTDFFSLAGIADTDAFFMRLDGDFYKEFPDQWEQESRFFIQHQDYTDILDGKRNSHARLKQKGEKTTHAFIERDGYHLWKVGRVYTVKTVGSSMRQAKLDIQKTQREKRIEKFNVTVGSSGVIGKLRLVAIRPGMQSDELIFEVA